MVKKDIIKKADRLAGFTALILIILGIIQIIYGELFLKSIALTANGIDCIGDGFVSAIVWIGLMFFNKPADQQFNYGYYKLENLASGLAAITMIGLAIYISFRSFDQLINTHPIETPLIGAILALLAAIIALFLGIYKYRKERKSKMNSIRLEAFNTIKDGVASGLTVIALIFSSFGIYIVDGIVGFIIAGIIVTIGFAAIKESSYMLIDACNGECIDIKTSIITIAEEFREINKAHIVRLRKSGPIYQGELEVEVLEDMKIKEFNKVKNKIINKVREIFPEIERLTVTVVVSDIDNKK